MVILTFWEDKVGGKLAKIDVEAHNYTYKVGPDGVWLMLIAAEDKEVKANQPVNIKIEDVDIPPESIVFPCSFMRHALGFIASLVNIGVPRKIEKRRKVSEVIFHPICDGKISKGELLGVINVFYAHPEYTFVGRLIEKWLSERYRY